jgi:predicted DNA-binding transcriptional regulator AlpA
MTKFECTSKVLKMRINRSDDEVSKRIGISKPTLYVRIKKHSWKVSEKCLIEALTI